MTLFDDIKYRLCDINFTFLGNNSFGKRYRVQITYDMLLPDSHEPGFNAPVMRKTDEKNRDTDGTKSNSSSENIANTWADTEEDIPY